MKKREKIMEYVFLLAAVISIVAVALICIFLFANGIPAIAKIGPLNFLLGEKWKPMNNIFGILPMIVGFGRRHDSTPRRKANPCLCQEGFL